MKSFPWKLTEFMKIITFLENINFRVSRCIRNKGDKRQKATCDIISLNWKYIIVLVSINLSLLKMTVYCLWKVALKGMAPEIYCSIAGVRKYQLPLPRIEPGFEICYSRYRVQRIMHARFNLERTPDLYVGAILYRRGQKISTAPGDDRTRVLCSTDWAKGDMLQCER